MVSIDQAITGTQSGESIRHMEAIAPNTYLPRADDGDVDAPSGDGAPNSVYSLDKGLEKLNAESVNYQPPHVGGFCDNGCGGGCQDAPETVPYPKAEMERVIGLLNDMKAANDALRQHVSAYSDEQKVAWYGQYRVEAEQGLNIAAHDEHIDAVVAVLPKALESSHGVLRESLSTIRAYAQVARNILAERADTQFKPVTGLLSVPLLASNPIGIAVAVGGSAMSAWDIWKNLQADKKGPAELQAALDALKDIAGRNDQDVEALRKAVEDWVQRPIDTSVIVKTGLPTAKPKDDAETKDEATESAIADPGAPVAAAPVSASPGGIGEADLGESKGGIPDDLPLDTGLSSDPMGGMPSAMPGMGGMPDMGMGSGMPGMSNTDPFAANSEPLAPVDDPFAKDDKDDDVLDPESDNPITDEDKDAELEPAEGGIPTDEDAITKDEEDGSEAPVEAEPVIQSVAATTDPAEAAVTPTSYTATMADGRQVELPTAKAAALVQSLSETPQGIRAAAADSGYTLPDDDLGIGIPVDEDAIRPGDVLMTETVKGVVIGNDELLTEEGRVVSINDSAVFSGALDGFYRLYDEDDATTPDPVTRGESPTPIGIGAPAEGSVSGTADPATIAASAETTSGETAPVSTPEPGDTPSIDPTQGVGEDTAPSSGTDDDSDGFGQVVVGDDDSDEMTVDGNPLFDTSAQG